MAYKKLLGLAFVAFGFIISTIVGYVVINYPKVGKTCGGVATNLPEYQCSSGLICVSDNKYADSIGRCQYIWPVSAFINKDLEGNYNIKRKGENDNELFCGGIANVNCPSWYRCAYDDNHPDAGGRCIK